MKKFIIYLFSLFSFLLIIVICFPLIIDKEKVIKFISEEISKKIDKEVSLENDLEISIFPSPSITINNLKVTDENKFIFYSEKVKIFSDWNSLVNQEPKLNKLEFFDSKLTLLERTIEKRTQQNLIKIGLSGPDVNLEMERLLSWIEVLKVTRGIIEIGIGEKKKFKDINFNFQNGIEKTLDGSLFYQNLNSHISYKLESKDFKTIRLELIHSFENSKNQLLYLNGIIDNSFKNFSFEGTLKGDSLDFENLKINKELARDISEPKLHDVGLLHNKKILLDIKTNINEITFSEKILRAVKFEIKFRDENLLIENFNAKYLNSNITLNSNYSINNKKLKGIIFVKNFEIPKKTLKIKQYDIFGGTGNSSIKFESTFRPGGINSLISDTKVKGKVFIENLTLSGFDIEKTVNKIDSIKNLSGFLNLFSGIENSGSSQLDIVEGEFNVKSGVLIIDDLITRNQNLIIKTTGEYNFKSEKFNLNNQINLKTNSYPDLPALSVRFFGNPDDFSTKFDFDQIRNKFLNEKVLKFNPKKILKIPLKNGKSLDLDNIIDLFSD